MIKYEEMNRDLDMVYTFRRWLSRHPEAGAAEKTGRRRVARAAHQPVCSHALQLRSAHRCAGQSGNPLSIRQERLQEQMDDLVAKSDRTEAESARLEDLKDALALLSGLEANNVREIEKRLHRVDQCIDGKSLDTGGLRSRGRGVSAERLYTNQKVTDLVAKAETEQNDYRRQHAINTFFSPEKQYDFHYYKFHWRSPHRTLARWTLTISVFTYSTGVLVGSSLILLGLLHYVLKQQLRMRAR